MPRRAARRRPAQLLGRARAGPRAPERALAPLLPTLPRLRGGRRRRTRGGRTGRQGAARAAAGGLRRDLGGERGVNAQRRARRARGPATFPGRNGRVAFVRGVYDPASGDWQSRDVYSVRPDGSGLLNLTRDRSVDQFSPAWSADGRRIAYVEADGATNLDLSGDELWTMRADGSRKRRLTENGTADEQPAWSPDGKWIVFSRRTSQRNADLAVIGSSGGRVRLLTRTTDLDELYPTWSPGGRRIAYWLLPRTEALAGRGGYYVLTVRTGRVPR